MMKTVNFLQRGHKRALQYEEKLIFVEVGQTDERYAGAQQDSLYLLRSGIKVTMAYLSKAINGTEETFSGTSLVIDVVDFFRKSVIQSIMALVHVIATEGEANVPSCKERLRFLKTEYMLGKYIATLKDKDLEKKWIKEPEEDTRRLQQLFATGRFGIAGETRNSFLLVSSGGGKRDELRVAKVLHSFLVSVTEDSKSRE